MNNRKALVAIGIAVSSALSAPGFCATTKGVAAFPLPKDVPMTASIDGKYMSLQGKFWSETGGLGGGQHIHWEATVTNRSKEKAFYTVNIAFMDKKYNLIAANGFTQVFAQAPGKTDTHSADLYLPMSELSNVALYELTFYDDTNNIGKQ